jgi:hypothetical protein
MLAGVSIAALSGAALAADDFFAIFGIPDHDQRRIQLPGNGGMYCAPTSAYNIVNYMAMHGVPSLYNCLIDPGNFNLINDPYKGHSQRILLMGAYMDTDAEDGTNGSGFTNGFINYVDDYSNIPAMLISYNKSSNFPSPNAMLAWMRLGGLVAFCYGRYTNPYGFNKDRDGGHCITLNQVRRTEQALPNPFDIPWLPQSYYTYQIGYRDPASDEGGGDPNRLYKQSTFATTIRDVFAEHANFDGTETTLYGIGSKPASNSDKYAYIDGYRVMLPMVMLTNKVTSDNFHLKLSLTLGTDGNYIERAQDLDLKLPADLGGDFAFDPIAPAFVRTMRGSKVIYQNEFLGESGRPLATARAMPIALEYGGPDLDLFVLQTDRISKLNRDGKWVKHRPFAGPPESMVYDPVRNQVLVGTETQILILNSDLVGVAKLDVRQLGGSGKQILRIDPATGDLYAMRQGTPTIHRLKRTDRSFKFRTSYSMTSVGKPMGFDFAGQYMYVSDGSALHQFTKEGRIAKGSPYNGVECGSMLKFGRSFTNYTPDRYPLPAWRDLLQPGVPLR